MSPLRGIKAFRLRSVAFPYGQGQSPVAGAVSNDNQPAVVWPSLSPCQRVTRPTVAINLPREYTLFTTRPIGRSIAGRGRPGATCGLFHDLTRVRTTDRYATKLRARKTPINRVNEATHPGTEINPFILERPFAVAVRFDLTISSSATFDVKFRAMRSHLFIMLKLSKYLDEMQSRPERFLAFRSKVQRKTSLC